MKENHLRTLAISRWVRLTNQGRDQEASLVLELINRRNLQQTWPKPASAEAKGVIK